MEYNFETVAELDKFVEQMKSCGMPLPADKAEELAAKRKELVMKEAASAKEESETPLFSAMKKQAKYPYTQEFLDCVTHTVDKLMVNEKDDPRATEPGLLLGHIQAGKTNTFEHIIALAFDKGIEVAIILTKGTNTLATQTLERAKSDFGYAKETWNNGQPMTVYVNDIMKIRSEGVATKQLTNQTKRQIIVCKKETKNLQSLIKLYTVKSPRLQQEKTLIIDDEADFASRVYKGSGVNVELAKLAELIDQFRGIPEYCRYLQVTATPYSLYLQPNGMLYNTEGGKLGEPFRPRFTEVVPVHSAYVGGKQYYEDSENEESMYNHLFMQVEPDCVEALGTPNKRYLSSSFESTNLQGIVCAIVGYFMAGAIREIQQLELKNEEYRSSFLIHVEIAKKNHEWQVSLIKKLINDIREHLLSGERHEYLDGIVEGMYDSYVESHDKGVREGKVNAEYRMPSLEETMEQVREILDDDDYAIRVVNSDHEVENMLDDKGQLKLTNTLNIFVGGSILDRGITIANMLCFFYGRNPKKFQMDTVNQHSRHFGARSMVDMSVTRFYTTARIYGALKTMYEIDKYLRALLLHHDENGNSAPLNAVIIGKGEGIKPCACNKIKLSETKVVSGGTRVLPVGFQTGSEAEIGATVKKIDEILQQQPGFSVEEPFLIKFDVAVQILELIESTYVFDEKWGNGDMTWKSSTMLLPIVYCFDFQSDPSDRRVWCQYREGRKMSRKRADGRFIDSPEDGDSDLAPAKKLADTHPVLTLLRQEGKEEQGWRGTPFYWPALLMPNKMRNAIFALDNQKVLEPRKEGSEEWKKIVANIPKSQIIFLTIKSEYLREIYLGAKHVEGREIKKHTANKYLLKNEVTDDFILADGVDPSAITAGFRTFNDGVFPYVLRKYQYMVLTNSQCGAGKTFVFKLDNTGGYPKAEFQEHGREDSLVDKYGDEEEVSYDNECQWLIFYKIGMLLGPKDSDWDQWGVDNALEVERIKAWYEYIERDNKIDPDEDLDDEEEEG